MNTETRIIKDKVQNNLEYWRHTIDTEKPIGVQLRRRIGLSDFPCNVLYEYAIDQVDWDKVAECIPRGTHLRDAEEGKEYIVKCSSIDRCKPGDIVHIAKLVAYTHLFIADGEGGCYSNEDIPDVWLVEKAEEKPEYLSSLTTSGDYTVVTTSRRPDFEVGDIINVSVDYFKIKVKRANKTIRTYICGSIPTVKAVKVTR